MENQQFKISNFAVNDPQEVTLLYDEFRPSDKYEGTFSTQVLHEDVRKWWNLKGPVVDSIKNMGMKKGDKILVMRQDGPNGKTYTKVMDPRDIEAQAQNLSVEKPKKEGHETIAKLPDEPVDWNDISLGKCRHGFAVRAFIKGLPATKETADLLNKWAHFSMTGEFPVSEMKTDLKPEDLPF